MRRGERLSLGDRSVYKIPGDRGPILASRREGPFFPVFVKTRSSEKCPCDAAKSPIDRPVIQYPTPAQTQVILQLRSLSRPCYL